MLQGKSSMTKGASQKGSSYSLLNGARFLKSVRHRGTNIEDLLEPLCFPPIISDRITVRSVTCSSRYEKSSVYINSFQLREFAVSVVPVSLEDTGSIYPRIPVIKLTGRNDSISNRPRFSSHQETWLPSLIQCFVRAKPGPEPQR